VIEDDVADGRLKILNLSEGSIVDYRLNALCLARQLLGFLKLSEGFFRKRGMSRRAVAVCNEEVTSRM